MPETRPTPSRSLRLVAALGLAWNAYGLQQFVATALATRDRLVAGGMTASQADLYLQLPAWMTVAFAVGVVAGTIGCVLLLFGRRAAAPIFGASCVGYLALYVGDLAEGVFAAFGASQVAVLTLVVAIALALFWMARTAGRAGQLA